MSSPLASFRIRAGVVGDGNRILAEALFEPGSTVVLGAKDVCNLSIPEGFGVSKRTVLLPGPRLRLVDDMRVQANIAYRGDVLPVRGLWSEVRKSNPDLDEEPIVVAEKVVIRFKRLSILFHFVP